MPDAESNLRRCILLVLDRLIRGSLERLTPVLMTALSAGCALIPLMIGADEPGKEIMHPVAIPSSAG